MVLACLPVGLVLAFICVMNGMEKPVLPPAASRDAWRSLIAAKGDAIEFAGIALRACLGLLLGLWLAGGVLAGSKGDLLPPNTELSAINTNVLITYVFGVAIGLYSGGALLVSFIRHLDALHQRSSPRSRYTRSVAINGTDLP